MNWVGGLRDQVRRRNEIQCKQKEYFEKKRLESTKRRKTKSSKKGISRDLINLACIAKTVRNPFDDNEHDADTQSFQSQPVQGTSLKGLARQRIPSSQTAALSVGQTVKTCRSKRPKADDMYALCCEVPAADTIHDEDVFFRSNNHQLKLRPPSLKKHGPVCHSTPFSFEAFERQNCSYSCGEHNSTAQMRTRNLPSPIHSQTSFHRSSIHPLSVLTDEELLLEQTSPFVESDSDYVEPLFQSSSFRNAIEASPHNFGDFLHGVPSNSFSVKEERVSPGHSPFLKEDKKLEQYNLVNRCLDCENSPGHNEQKDQIDFPSEFHQSIPDNQVPDFEASGYMRDDHDQQPTCRIRSPPDDECVIEDESIYIPGTTISSAPSMGSLSSRYSSSDSAITVYPSNATSVKQERNEDIPFYVLSHVDPVSSGQNQSVDATQQTEVPKDNCLLRHRVDASTSPITWPTVDISVQTDQGN